MRPPQAVRRLHQGRELCRLDPAGDGRLLTSFAGQQRRQDATGRLSEGLWMIALETVAQVRGLLSPSEGTTLCELAHTLRDSFGSRG
jgi:hypothetical protein